MPCLPLQVSASEANMNKLKDAVTRSQATIETMCNRIPDVNGARGTLHVPLSVHMCDLGVRFACLCAVWVKYIGLVSLAFRCSLQNRIPDMNGARGTLPDVVRTPCVLCGVKYIDLVSLAHVDMCIDGTLHLTFACLDRAPYVLYGVEYIYQVPLALVDNCINSMKQQVASLNRQLQQVVANHNKLAADFKAKCSNPPTRAPKTTRMDTTPEPGTALPVTTEASGCRQLMSQIKENTAKLGYYTQQLGVWQTRIKGACPNLTGDSLASCESTIRGKYADVMKPLVTNNATVCPLT